MNQAAPPRPTCDRSTCSQKKRSEALAAWPSICMTPTALRKADFVVSLELFNTEAAAMSHVVLPACSYAEADGSMTNAERRIQQVSRIPIEQLTAGTYELRVVLHQGDTLVAQSVPFRVAD